MTSDFIRIWPGDIIVTYRGIVPAYTKDGAPQLLERWHVRSTCCHRGPCYAGGERYKHGAASLEMYIDRAPHDNDFDFAKHLQEFGRKYFEHHLYPARGGVT